MRTRLSGTGGRLLALGLAAAWAAPAFAQVAPIPAPRVGGYLQFREVAQSKAGLSASLNRARFSIDGTLPSRMSYRFLVETEASTGIRTPAAVSLREAYARWSSPKLAFTGGQFKMPFAREYLVPVPALETPDLSAVVDSLAPKYDIGAMAEFTPGPWGSLAFAVCNGEGANNVANRDSAALVVARAVVRPVPPLSLGASAARDRPDSLRWGVEAVVEQWGGMVRAEWIVRHKRGRASEKDDQGGYILATMRVMPMLSLVGKLEDYRRPWSGPARRVQGALLGTNYELGRVRWIADFVRHTTGATRIRTDQFVTQLQLRF
jgi:hypothetical protein